jgi:hypothetical protein
MSLVKRSRPSPAMIVAALALCFAMVGTAVAGTDAVSKLTKSKVKTIAKKQADKELKANVSGSHVNTADKATSADTATTATTASNALALGGKAPSAFQSSARQNYVPGNLNLSNVTPTTINTLVLPGPASYMVTTSASIFDSAAAGTTCNAHMELLRNGVALGGHNEVGAERTPAGDFDVGTYATERLVNITGASQTITTTGVRQSGAGTCVAFEAYLIAEPIDTVVGAQSPSSGDSGPVGTPSG